MRCPDCNKFVSYDDSAEPEVNSEELSEITKDEDGTYTGSVVGEVRIVLPCAECGTELKESNQEFEIEFNHECNPEALKAAKAERAKKAEVEPGEDDDYFELACGCVPSKDIGRYSTCMHLCGYCYANSSAAMVVKNYAEYRRLWEEGADNPSII